MLKADRSPFPYLNDAPEPNQERWVLFHWICEGCDRHHVMMVEIDTPIVLPHPPKQFALERIHSEVKAERKLA
jgi:hypothetical protein